MSAAPRLRRPGVSLLLAALLLPLGALPARAQATGAGSAGSEAGSSRIPARAALALEPDSVRVGEPFVLGIAIRAEPGWQPTFPAVLPVGGGFEQRAAAEVRQPGPHEWRAYYRLVAWEIEPGPLPPVEIELATDGELRTVALQPPGLTVSSVLPSDRSDLELRPERPFLTRARLPWLPLLVGLLLAAVLLAWWWRRRRRAEAALGSSDEGAYERAWRELRELRRLVEAGELGGAPFYDRLEGSLRRYAEATRGWAPGTLMRRLPDGNRQLASVLRRSMLARFGRVEWGGEVVGRALEVCEAWLATEAPSEPGSEAPSEPGSEAPSEAER